VNGVEETLPALFTRSCPFDVLGHELINVIAAVHAVDVL
jgi:hypothetical protein